MSEGRCAVVEKLIVKGKAKLLTYQTWVRNTTDESIDIILGYWLHGTEIGESRVIGIKAGGLKYVDNSVLGHPGIGQKAQVKLFAVRKSEKSLFKVDKFDFQYVSSYYVEEMGAAEVLPAPIPSGDSLPGFMPDPEVVKEDITTTAKNAKEVVAEGVASLPSMPSFGAAKVIGLIVILIVGLIALGYSGVGGMMGREHERARG